MANKPNESKAIKPSSANNPKKKPAAPPTKTGEKKNIKRPQSNPGSSSAKAKQAAFEKQKQVEKQNKREVLAIVFFLVAFVFVICWFNTEAALMGPVSRILTGLFGIPGKIMLPMVLVYNGIILLTNFGYPVKMRTWCSFFCMIFACGLFHSISDLIGNMRNTTNIRDLWDNAQVLKSCGVIPGLLAQFLTKCITRFGAIVVMLIAAILCFFATRNITVPGVIAAWHKQRPEPIAKVRENPSERLVARITEVHQEKQERQERQERQTRKRTPLAFDVPVDEPPLRKGNDEQEAEQESYYEPELSPSERMARKNPQRNEEKKNEHPESVQEESGNVRRDTGETVEEIRKEHRRTFIFDDPVPNTEEPVQEVVEEPLIPDFMDQKIPEDPTYVPAPEEEPKKTKEPDREKITKASTQAIAEEIAQDIAEHPQAGGEYVFPSIELLNRASRSSVDATTEMRENSKRLADALQSFGVTPHIVDVIRGPSVTRYELELDPGVKLSKITNLSEDIALALGAEGVRISAIPDKISVVGIEVPNKIVNTVYAREVIGSTLFTEKKSKVSFAVGKDISGACIIGDIAKMPHMLIAGTTGSGKSVCMNTLIISLLYKARPDEVKMIMVDPKMVELGIYNGIPHLLIPVVTDPKKAAGALQWTVTEMLRRYTLMSDEGVRDLESYNKSVANDPDREKLPQVVVVIDELADLMLVAAKEVEESICRIAQMGRASGIHLVIATQRPSADVITGTMKANIPSRIAFSVSSAMEPRIILDMQGAEKLVGKGDMLFAPHGQGKPQRVQGCFITDDEVSRVIHAIKANSTSDYSHEVMEQIEKRAEQGNKSGHGEAPPPPTGDGSDEMLPAAVEVILETGQASVSMLQRRLKLGYARAARIVDEMEEKGIVGPFESAKPRQLLITRDQWELMKNGGVPEPVPDEIT